MPDTGKEGYYMATMKLAKELLDMGLITAREYREFDKKMTEKYNPEVAPFMLAITDR